MSEDTKGAFREALERNSKQIRGARAAGIYEDALMQYRRDIEDLARKIRQKERTLEDMLDFGADSTISLKLAENFKADEWVTVHTKLSVEIRNDNIQLDIMRGAFRGLFAEEA